MVCKIVGKILTFAENHGIKYCYLPHRQFRNVGKYSELCLRRLSAA